MDSFNAQSSGFIAVICPSPLAPGRSARVVLSAVENALLQVAGFHKPHMRNY